MEKKIRMSLSEFAHVSMGEGESEINGNIINPKKVRRGKNSKLRKKRQRKKILEKNEKMRKKQN